MVTGRRRSTEHQTGDRWPIRTQQENAEPAERWAQRDQPDRREELARAGGVVRPEPLARGVRPDPSVRWDLTLTPDS